MTNGYVESIPDLRRLQSRLLLILVGITLAVFAGVCGHEFVHYDDKVNIYGNAHVQGLSWDNLKWMFTNNGYAPRYMPLGWLSYAVDYQCFGLNPQAYHAVNLLLHLCNVGLVFFLIKELLLLPGKSANSQILAAAPLWCAAVGALFWAVNPLRVEVVAWASSRIYGLALLFVLLWLLAWLRAHDQSRTRESRRLFYWLAVVAYAASLFTYPLALFAPVALFVLEKYLPERLKNFGKERNIFSGWRDKIPVLIVSTIVLFITIRARIASQAMYLPVTFDEFSLAARLMQAFYIWAYYVWKPWSPYDLAAVYPTLHSFNHWSAVFLLSAVLVLAVSVATVWWRRRWPGLFALWVCHLAILIPVLGLTEYPHCAYDRYSYMQGILWSIGIAVVARGSWERGRKGHLAALAFTGASLVFAASAWQQVPVWDSTITLYEHLVSRWDQHPGRARFDEVLGVHYLRCGLTNEAATSFKNAIYFESRRADRNIYDGTLLYRTHIRLGDLCAEQGEHEEALAHYIAALELDPQSLNAMIKIGSLLGVLNRDPEALKFFRDALRLNPTNAQAHHNLAVVLRKTGQELEADEHFREERRLLAE